MQDILRHVIDLVGHDDVVNLLNGIRNCFTHFGASKIHLRCRFHVKCVLDPVNIYCQILFDNNCIRDEAIAFNLHLRRNHPLFGSIFDELPFELTFPNVSAVKN